jgi:IS5 family transposase
LQTEPPIDPSSVTRWRKRLGEAAVEELLAETIEAAKRAGMIKASSAKRVIVDTTVRQKAIAHPTDPRLPSLRSCLPAMVDRGQPHQPTRSARHGADHGCGRSVARERVGRQASAHAARTVPFLEAPGKMKII